MPTVSVRVEEDLRDRAEEAAATASLSLSEWARLLMRTELGMDVPEFSAPSSLSKLQRLQLVLLHRTAAGLTNDIDEREYHERRIEVLEHGFTLEYSDEFLAIFDEMPLSECRLVMDILDMFRVVEASVDAIGIESLRAVSGDADHALRFRGFDFNDQREGRLADYAKYLISDGRWAELAVYFNDEHERGNSHMPTLGSYLRMLTVFKPIWDAKVSGIDRGRYLLDENELASITAAWAYPK